MAPGLLDLPNEVLAQVFSYLDTSHLRACDWDPESKRFTGEEYTNSRPSLCAVALVNRRLHHIARRVLLEDISLHVGSSGPRYPPMFELAAKNFAKDCIKHPAILEHLRKFRIWWWAATPADWAFTLFNTVSLAPNLIDFRIGRFEDYTNPECRLQILETLARRLRFLEVFIVHIHEVCIPHDLFLGICGMRNLRSFETSCPILALDSRRKFTVGIDDFGKDVPKGRVQETRLEKLRCTGEYVDLAVLRHVLLRSPRLKKLILSLPGPGLHPSNGESFVPDGFKDKTLGQLLRPDLVSRMLMPCASSLCELAITNDSMKLSLTNGTFIDLSSFSQLRRLTLSNRLICTVTDQGIEEFPNLSIDLPGKDWYKCLPMVLDFLKIQFDSAQGLLWNLLALRMLENSYNDEWASDDPGAHARAFMGWHSDFEFQYFKPSVSDEIKDASFHRLSWVMDLVKDVSSKFQCLRTIKIVENDKVLVDQRGGNCELVDLVEAYPEAFSCPGVGLELSVRVPHGYNPPPLNTIKFEPADESSHNAAVPISQIELLRALAAQDSIQTVMGRLSESQSWDDTIATAWGNDG